MGRGVWVGVFGGPYVYDNVFVVRVSEAERHWTNTHWPLPCFLKNPGEQKVKNRVIVHHDVRKARTV